MSRPIQPKSLKQYIAYYLYKNRIRLEINTFDYQYVRLPRDRFCKEMAQDIYNNRHMIFDFNGDKAIDPNKGRVGGLQSQESGELRKEGEE